MNHSKKHYRCPSCDWTETLQTDNHGIILGAEGFLECPECGELDLQIIMTKPKNTAHRRDNE